MLTPIPNDPSGEASPGDAPSALHGSTIDAGTSHSCATISGALYCWGDNQDGELGLADSSSRARPTRVGSLDDWEEVSTGERHTCARRATGALLCFGANDRHQLGDTALAKSVTPVPVSLPAAATRVVTEANHSCAITSDGALYCWGENLEGELGQGDVAPIVDSFEVVQVGAQRDWTLVDTGQGNTCGVRGAGELYCWGRNTGLQLGLGDGAPIQVRVVTRSGDALYRRVQTGQDHTCGIRLDGTLHCWGSNASGNLGTGDRSRESLPVQIGDKQDWLELSLDNFHSCAVDSAEHLFCWGRNAEGQLGTGDIEDRLIPTQVQGDGFVKVAVGRFHTCALKADESVWCTGKNDTGELGTGDTDRRNTFSAVIVSGSR